MISNVNVLSENRSVAFLAISGALARGALGGPHTPGQVGVLYGPQTPGQNFQFISHHSSIIPVYAEHLSGLLLSSPYHMSIALQPPQSMVYLVII